MQTQDAKPTPTAQAHQAPADSFFSNACADAYDQTRVFNAEETIQQASQERDRVSQLLAGWAKGQRPAQRPYRVRREARAIASAMREPTTADVWKGA